MLNQDNIITVCGRLDGEPAYAYTAFKEPFYTGFLLVERLSGAVDRLPVTIPGKIRPDLPADSRPIVIRGQVRSYNKTDENGVGRLEITIFANEISVAEIDDTTVGDICEEPTLGLTLYPDSVRIISDHGNCSHIDRFFLRYDTGERTRQFADGTIGELNDGNVVKAPLPDSLDEVVGLLRRSH